MSNDFNAIPKSPTQIENNQKQVIIYARLSSKEQGRDGISLEDQEREARRFCAEFDLDVIGVYSETSSARGEDKRSRRLLFNKVVELSIRNDIAVVVTKCDRFSRSFPSYERFENAGGKLIPVELLQLNPDPAEIRALIKRAEAESDRGARLAREGIARKRAAGKTFGNPNLSEARPAAAAVNRAKSAARLEAFANEVAKARAAGREGSRAITEYLNTQSSLMTPTGAPWGEENVRRMLKKLRAQTRGIRSLPSSGMDAEPDSVPTVDKGLAMPVVTDLPEMAARDDDAVWVDLAGDNPTPADQIHEEVVIDGDYSYVARERVVEEAPGVFTRVEVDEAPAYEESGSYPFPDVSELAEEFVEPTYEWPEYADGIEEIEELEPEK